MKVKKYLIEDIVDDLAQDPDTQVDVLDKNKDPKTEKTVLQHKLDRALKVSLRAHKVGHGWSNILVVGEAGIGKTAIIRKWASDNGINLLSIKAGSMDETDVGGAIAPDLEKGVARRLSTEELDELDNVPNSVLFLDELNRARKNVRGTLLTLIQDHTVPDARVKNGERYLKNFLFTIAAVNPFNANYNTDELDDAEMGRFGIVYYEAEPKAWLRYQLGALDELAREDKDDPEALTEYSHKKNLITALITKDFKFNNVADIEKSHESGNGLITNPRNLENLVNYCDGTKQDFLDNWNSYCNSLDKPMIERILGNYVDKEDKANDALKYKSERAQRLAKQSENDEPEVKDKSDNPLTKVIDNNPDLAGIL